LVAAGAGAVIGGAGAAALGSAAGVAIIGSLFGVAGAGLTGKLLLEGASVAEWLRSLTSNHLPLTIVGSNFLRDFVFFHVRKLFI
jgi:hypothetical protein